MSYNLDAKAIPDPLTYAEQTLLITILKNPAFLNEYDLKHGIFLTEPYKTIFSLVSEQFDIGAPITEDHLKITYRDKFKEENNKDLAFSLTSLFNQCSWSILEMFPYYFKVLNDRKVRNLLELVKDSCSGSPDVKDDLENLIEATSGLLNEYAPKTQATFNEKWVRVLEIADDAQHGIFPHFLKTHYESLDNMIGEGILDDYLVVLGADSGAGKTTFALNLVRNIARHDKHSTLYFSFEMGDLRLMRWFMSACTAIPMSHFTSGKLGYEHYVALEEQRTQKLCANPLIIVETFPELTNVVNQIRTYVKRHPEARFIIIDHLHLMHVKGQERDPTNAVSMITKSLKQLTMELQIPILLLSQLLKPAAPVGQVRPDPTLSLLKGSGSIITDADLIMMLQIDQHSNSQNNLRVVRNYILKNRGGRAGNDWVGFAHLADRCVMNSN